MTGQKSKEYGSENSMVRQLGLFDSSMMMMGYAWPLIDELKGGLDCLSKALRGSI